MIGEKEIKKVLDYVQKSKKYKPISKTLIKDEIKKYFKINPKALKFIDKEKSSKFKDIVKGVRSKLHFVHGSFQKEGKKDIYLKQIYGINDYKNHDKILVCNLSTKERLNDYQKLYKVIFKITGKPKSILDLGCGINPVSYPYMGVNGISYYAYDINEDDCGFLNRYFKLMKDYTGIKGKSFVLDLSKIANIKKLPKADVCFMFKFLDVVERKGHKFSEDVIKNLNCKYIVASFSTKTVSGKNMKHPYRGWIEKMLERINLEYEKIFLDNEVFYVIKK